MTWQVDQREATRSGAGINCLPVGVLMVAWWAAELSRGAPARPDRSRPEIVLQLTTELVIAALLAAGGAPPRSRPSANRGSAGLAPLQPRDRVRVSRPCW